MLVRWSKIMSPLCSACKGLKCPSESPWRKNKSRCLGFEPATFEPATFRFRHRTSVRRSQEMPAGWPRLDGEMSDIW